jgi:hypothetical protein
MHDCANCRVPLHGHEEVCPSCGAKQIVRQSTFSSDRFATQKEPSINVVPIIIAIVVVGIGIFAAMQVSWVGQVMNRGPVAEDPMEKMTYTEARQIIESKITQGLAAVGAKGKFSWTASGQPVDKNADQMVELDIQTRLKDKEQRKAIIDPIKEFMAKAKIPTLTMTDSKSRATWTYTCNIPAPVEEEPILPPPGQQQAPPEQAQQQVQQPVEQAPVEQPVQQAPPEQQQQQQQPADPLQEYRENPYQ